MKRLIIAIFALALAACGGGGSGPGPVPSPVPTQTPRASYSVAMQWTGFGHSIGAKGLALRTPFAVFQNSSEPIEIAPAPPCQLGSLHCNSIQANTNAGSGSLQVAVVDQNGNIINDGPATVQVANTADATATAAPTPTSSPQPFDYAVNSQTNAPAQTTVTTTFQNVPPATLPIKIYSFVGFEYPTVQDQDAALGYNLQGSTLVPASNPATADVSIQCANGTATINAPLGQMLLPGTTAIGSITSALPFTATGNSEPLSTLLTSPSVILTASGEYVLIKWGVAQTSDCASFNMIAGVYKVSDANGNFST